MSQHCDNCLQLGIFPVPCNDRVIDTYAKPAQRLAGFRRPIWLRGAISERGADLRGSRTNLPATETTLRTVFLPLERRCNRRAARLNGASRCHRRRHIARPDGCTCKEQRLSLGRRLR